MGTSPVEYTIGDWISTELAHRGLNQSELAYLMGMRRQTVSGVITGRRAPGKEFLTALAQALAIPEEDVFRAAHLLPERPAQEEYEELAAKIQALPFDAQASVVEFIDLLILKLERQRAAKIGSPRSMGGAT